MLDRAEPQIIPPYHRGSEGYRKGRILTDLLKAVAEEQLEIKDAEGNTLLTITKKEALAKMVWDGALTGKIPTIDGTLHPIGIREHIDLIKWIYSHIDGPPRQEVQVEVQDGNSEGSTLLTNPERIRRIAELMARKAESEGIRITGPDSEPARGTLLQYVAKDS